MKKAIIVSAILLWMVSGVYALSEDWRESFPLRVCDTPVLLYCGAILGPVAFLKWLPPLSDRVLLCKKEAP